MFRLPLKTAHLITVETNHSSHDSVDAREGWTFASAGVHMIFMQDGDHSVVKRGVTLGTIRKGAKCILPFGDLLPLPHLYSPFHFYQCFSAFSLDYTFKSLQTDVRKKV